MIKNFIYSVFSGLLFFLSWPTKFPFLTPLIFCAFIPLLLIHRDVKINNKKYILVFFYSYISFLIFNFSTTFWIEKASPAFGEGLFAVLCNAFFMTLVFTFFHILNTKFKTISGLFFLSSLWIGFEILHFNWDLNWPWLTLGNVFSIHPNWVQWYSYTGVLGGTLWVLIVNYFCFYTYFNFPYKRALHLKDNILILSLILFPIVFSYIIYFTVDFEGKEAIVLVAQSNINPHTEKFNKQAYKKEKSTFYNLTNNVNDSIDYIVFPETYLSMKFTSINYGELDYNRNQISHITRMVETYPELNIILGASIYDFVDRDLKKSYKKRPYELHNSAIQINSENIQYYYKSKLVPGAEQLPFEKFLKPFFGSNFLKLAGYAGNFSGQDTVSLLLSKNNKIAALVCYESVFPNHVRRFIQKGAEAIFVITNDGWWGNTEGRKQHNAYACIRALETRRYVVRSANTGISSVINPFGKIEYSLKNDIEGSFIKSIQLLSQKTF